MGYKQYRFDHIIIIELMEWINNIINNNTNKKSQRIVPIEKVTIICVLRHEGITSFGQPTGDRQITY